VRNNSDPKNDGQLIKQAHSSPEAFAKLYRRHYDAIFRYCAHRLFDRHLAEDVTSTVFLTAVKNFRRFKGAEIQFRNWLYRIATNAVNLHLRKNIRRANLLKMAAEKAHNSDCTYSEHKIDPRANPAALKEALLTLRPRYQAIITLRYFENLKLTEIAQVLGGSNGTVRSQLSRALARLRKALDCGAAVGRPGGNTNER